MFNKHSQLIIDTFNKIDFRFKKGKKILDIGCGSGEYLRYFDKKYNLNIYGVDTYQDLNIKNISNIKFQIGSIYNLPFKIEYFDYVFLHDVLHHVDEKKQRIKKHLEALKQIKRVTKKKGHIIIIEANRYAPLTYLNMVLIKKHDHFSQKYFKYIINKSFSKSQIIKFIFFEAHAPPFLPKLWNIFWKIYDMFSSFSYKNYNAVIIKK